MLHAWLHDLHFEDYYSNFVQAGYDMPTISRMTPEVPSFAIFFFLEKCTPGLSLPPLTPDPHPSVSKL